MVLLKCCTQYVSKFQNLCIGMGLGNVSFHSNPKEGNAKECSNYCTIALTSHTSKVMLKILQARLQQYLNFQMFKLDLEKVEEPQIQFPTSAGSLSERIPDKHLLLYWLYKSLWLYVSQQTVENSSKDGNTRTHYLSPEKSVCRSKNNS